jgi:ABC-type glycerol-3-phosphate transport system substrate-binding protein
MENFSKEYPHIHVQWVEIDPSSQPDLPTQASLADTSLLFGRSAVISGKSYFRSLTPFIESDPHFQSEDFWPNALTGCMDQEGQSYGIPMSLDMLGILYDPTALAAAGLPDPQPGWSWDDFQQFVSAIPSGQGASRQYPFVDLPVVQDSQTQTAIFLLAPVIDAYLSQQDGVVDSSTLLPLIQWYLDLAQKKQIIPVAAVDHRGVEPSLVQDGDPTMTIGAINSQLKNNAFALSKYHMAPFPVQSAADAGGTTPMNASCGVISAGSSHPKEAWIWLNYLSHQWIHGDERLAYINQAIPARQSVVNKNPFWENIPENAQQAYRFGAEHGWYGSAYPGQLMAVTQAIIESTGLQTPFANALQSSLANQSNENQPMTPGEQGVVATPRPDRADTTSIRYFSNQVFQDADKLKRLAEKFQRDHPEIEIDLPSPGNPADFPGSQDDLFDYPAENYDCFELNLPDLSMKDLSVIRDINSWVDQDTALRADLFPGQIEAYTVDGRVYGLPASERPNLMFYNKTLLNRLRLPFPENDWTFDDFLQMATAASTTLDGQQVYGFAPYAVRDVGLLLAGRGMQWIDPGGAYPQVQLKDPSVENAYVWIDSLRQSGVLLPTTAMDSSEEIQKVLAAGQLAFWTAESTPWGGWYFNSMENIPYEIGAVPLPVTPVQNPANNPGMTGLFISSKSQNAQACWAWIRFLSEQPDAFSGVPARRSVAASPAWESTVGKEKANVYRAALEQTDSALRPSSWQDPVLTGLFSFSAQALEEVFAGSQPEIALSTAQRKADFVLQCLEKENELNLPTKDREGVVNACLQQVDAVK